MAHYLFEYLNRARRSHFVGRESELSRFQNALDGPEPFAFLHIYGPGGVGKSTLLREFYARSREHDADAILLDASDLEPTPEAFLAGLSTALNGTQGVDPLQKLNERVEERKQVLLLDTSEKLLPLDDWLRERFLPRLPTNMVVVMAGREKPSLAWRRDPGWQQIMQSIDLRNFTPDESRALLQRREVPAERQETILNFTYGHPLALSLVADVLDQRPDREVDLARDPNIISSLLEQLLEEVPGPAHRAALEVCGLVRTTTEALLCTLLQIQDANPIFSWMRRLSFIQTRPGGLAPHDLARQALRSDLRWRNPDWHATLHTRARTYYKERLERVAGEDQQRTLLDYVYLHRDNPVVQPFFEWRTAAGNLPGPYRPSDRAELLAMTNRHEGPASARLLAHWLERQPHNVLVFRTVDDEPTGFVVMLALEEIDDEEHGDPAVSAALAHLDENAPLRPGERATHFRFWMEAESYQMVSPLQSLIFINVVRHYLTTPGLAYTFFPCADPDFWSAGLRYGELMPVPQADFSVDGRHFGVFGHDWRAMPPLTWLDLLAAKELSTAAEPARPAPVRALMVLSEPDFAEAVRAFLRDYPRPDVLQENPLLWSRMVQDGVGAGAGVARRLETLRALITSTTESLRTTPRGAKLADVLHHTYLEPAGTQEEVSEMLDLPHGTYRRYLRGGVERLTELLWLRETGRSPR